MAKDKQVKKGTKQAKPRNATRRTALKAGAIAVGAVTVAGNVGLRHFKSVLDGRFGRGEMTVTQAEGTEDWDSQYVKQEYSSLEEAKAASDVVSEQMTDEGIVLLKNDGVLPLASGSTVTPFGWGWLNPSYSGNGAAASTDTTMVTPEAALSSRFTINTAAADAMSAAEPSSPDAAAGTDPLTIHYTGIVGDDSALAANQIMGYDPSIYASIADDVAGTVGLVFVVRNGSENLDKRTVGYDDGTPHYLALTQAEKDTIKFARESCGSVVLILNTANPMELAPAMAGDYEADAILWVGTTGSRGFESMAKILAGEVNPSGRLTDTYPTDFTKDPTYYTFGSFEYDNCPVEDVVMVPTMNIGTYNAHYVEYREGVYVGYRYYETAAAEDPSFVYGTLDGQGGIAEAGAVAYPFGYGLSYTSFEQRVDSFSDAEDAVSVSVAVTNTGDVAGKEVVQLYVTKPYTDYDRENGIEKPATELVDFAKTDLLQPGESQTVDFQIAKEGLASYSYRHENADGTTGCYVLEEGDYVFEVKANSHDVLDSAAATVDETTFYEPGEERQSERDAQSELDDEGNPTGATYDGSPFVAATNQLQDLTDYMHSTDVVTLSRADWTGTQPSEQPRSKEAPQDVVDELNWNNNFDYASDETLGNVEGSLVYSDQAPSSGEQNGLSLIQLRGLDYHDATWDQLLDEIDWDADKGAIQSLLYEAAYQTGELTSVGKPATTDADGVTGWSSDGASSWATTNLLAASWNTDLFLQMGTCIGEESLHLGTTGWYAPSTTLHRSPFGGRVYEGYSEDPVIAGKVSEYTIEGAAEKGCIAYFKHFTMNNQETWRNYSLCTWADEQAVREIYLKPFEIAIKNAQNDLSYISDNEGTVSTKRVRSANALMSSYNFVGGVASFARYGLIHTIVRDEWGFTGAIITDLQMNAEARQRDLCMRTGNDLYMCSGTVADDYDSATARTLMRESLHRVLFATANSNAMNGLTPGSVVSYAPGTWEVGLNAATGVLVAVEALLIAGIVRGGKKDKAAEADKADAPQA